VALEGKVALVTGAGSGIGEATVVALREAGAEVVGMDLAEGSDVIGDVRSREDVAAAVAFACDRFGGLDLVVANAAVSIYEELEQQSEETLDLILDTNLKGALLCAQLAIPELKRRGGGNIVFVSSVQASVPLPGCVPYAAAKAGLVTAARALAAEVGRHCIRVNAIAPGTIDTPMLRRDLSGMNLQEADAFRRRVEEANALGRIGTAEEIAAVVVWLASDASSYVTGATILADGGFSSVKSF
jgi:NAD(P)-dependent dehydrogenase (short-subunit alcohol dehydrogenase family)